MTNLEKMKTGTRKVNSCSVNSLVFAGFQGQNTGNTPNANTTDNNNNNNYVVGNSNRKRPYSVGFTGGLLPLCAPSCADESAPTTGGNATAGSGVNVGSGLGVGVGCGTTCYDPHRAISSYPRLQPSRQRVNNITAAPAPPRQNRHRQNRRTDVDNPRSRSAPNLNAPNVGRCHAPSTVHVGLDALDKRPCDKSSNPTSSSSTSYCWLTDTDIRSNRTKEAAGRFYKHTYGTGSCNSIKVNFPAAGTFVDNHKLNSKLRGYMQWSESRFVPSKRKFS